MSPCFSRSICFLSLMPVSGLNLWNHYRAFSQVQSQCLFFNMYLQVFRALWVLRGLFWLTCQYWVGSKHLNWSIILYFSRPEHRRYLESVGLPIKNKYVDRHTVYRIFRNWYFFFRLPEQNPCEFLSPLCCSMGLGFGRSVQPLSQKFTREPTFTPFHYNWRPRVQYNFHIQNVNMEKGPKNFFLIVISPVLNWNERLFALVSNSECLWNKRL